MLPTGEWMIFCCKCIWPSAPSRHYDARSLNAPRWGLQSPHIEKSVTYSRSQQPLKWINAFWELQRRSPLCSTPPAESIFRLPRRSVEAPGCFWNFSPVTPWLSNPSVFFSSLSRTSAQHGQSSFHKWPLLIAKLTHAVQGLRVREVQTRRPFKLRRVLIFYLI